MQNRRRLVRVNVEDFLEIRPTNEVARVVTAQSKNITPFGICFCSEIHWKKGEVLYIDYFLPEDFDSVKLKVVVIWSEFIDQKQGYFCGTQIIDIEKEKEEKFINYYNKLLNQI